MIKELRLWLDYTPKMKVYHPYYTVADTERAFCSCQIVHTTIPHFLSFDYAEKLFVHIKEEAHEIKIGKTEGIDKEIRKAHNLEKLLFAGAFDWFQID